MAQTQSGSPPPAPPPPRRHGGRGGSNPDPPPKSSGSKGNVHAQRSRNVGIAAANLANALTEQKGIDPATAQHFARVMLANPAVQIGSNGTVYFHGKPMDASAFASSPLADLVRGATSAKQNQAAILGDPGYQQQLATLQLQRELSTAGLGDQRTRAIIDFGDPGFANDPTLAGEAQANPFSTIAGLTRQNQLDNAAAQEAANRAGTYQGGGLQSGLGEAQRVNAARVTDATRSLSDLLSGLASQQAQAGQVYQLGQAQSQQDAYQRLLQSGGLHAASFTPGWQLGSFRYYHPPAPPHQTGGGHVGGPPPPPPPPRNLFGSNGPYAPR